MSAPPLSAPLFVTLRSDAPAGAVGHVPGEPVELCAGPRSDSAPRPEPSAPAALAAFDEWSVGTWSEFEAQSAQRTVVVPDADEFGAVAATLGARPVARDAWIGLAELAAVLAPGPLATGRLDAVLDLVRAERGEPRRSGERHDLEVLGPAEVHAASRALVRRFVSAGPDVMELVAFAWKTAARGFQESEPATAQWLGRLFALVDWIATRDGLDPVFSAPSSSRGFDEGLDDLLEDVLPRWSRELAELATQDPLPPRVSDPTPFEAGDHAALELVFERDLPAAFGGGGDDYRPGQHEVARRIARNLDRGELFVAHAPTGTGKTLAYLVPALLWSVRHGVRVGISTYTRALQEQAIENDVPLARRALARAGSSAAAARVALLKGRDNYLCWRALALQRPASADDPETWLAWAYALVFALQDETGDLDRLPRKLPGPALGTQRISRELEALVRLVRAASGCCHATRDRRTCGAEVARARAERSHVVITNHSFALARPEFFRNLVFDECEHLHDQAASAWSHAFGLAAARRKLLRLSHPGRPMSRAPLDALRRALPAAATATANVELEHALEAHEEALAQHAALEREVREFTSWRRAAARQRHQREEHMLFRQWVLEGSSTALLAAREGLARAFEDLEIALTGLLEELDTLALSGVPRWRRACELARAEILELGEHLAAWIPLVDGAPIFDPTRLHDVEEDPRGDCRLVARVLAPGEHLGRHYYPDLQSAAFVSATTWLQGGFSASLGYLGLDRAAEPAPDEEREPRAVELLRAPSPFDYARVLVCVPTDAPRYDGGAREFHDYVRRFLAHLCERTRGRTLALFTNADDVAAAGAALAGFFRVRGLPLWYQNMPGLSKEDLTQRFRSTVESTLLGVDTFWYGADFPGETLEYLVLVRLPYGVPDRYHHAQCALFGTGAQRKRVYLPRALAKFRQGFGRLMRKPTDSGVVFLLDNRVLTGPHRAFLGELPLATDEFRSPEADWDEGGARLVRAPTDEVFEAAFEHTGIAPDVAARGLDGSFWEGHDDFALAPPMHASPFAGRTDPRRVSGRDPDPDDGAAQAARGERPAPREARPAPREASPAPREASPEPREASPEPREARSSAEWVDPDELPF